MVKFYFRFWCIFFISTLKSTFPPICPFSFAYLSLSVLHFKVSLIVFYLFISTTTIFINPSVSHSLSFSFIFLPISISVFFLSNSKWHRNVHIISRAKSDWQQNWKWHQRKIFGRFFFKTFYVDEQALKIHADKNFAKWLKFKDKICFHLIQFFTNLKGHL